MKSLRYTVSFLVAVFLAGCMTGPDYQRPDLATPGNWSQPMQGGEKADTPEAVHWWKEFSDSRLDALVSRALAANLDIRLAESRIREARGNLVRTGAALWPQLNVSGSYQRRQIAEINTSRPPSARANAVFSKNGLTGLSISGTSPAGPGVSITPDLRGGGNTTVGVSAGTESLAKKPDRQMDLYQTGFDASWELDIFGATRRAKEAARAEIEAAEENRRAVYISVAAEMARSYFDLRALQHRLAIARSNTATVENSLQLVQARFDAGLTSELDVRRAEAQLANTRALIPALEYGIEQAIHRMSILCAEIPGALREELITTEELPDAPPEVLVGIPSELLRRRPDIRRDERLLAAATARIGVATADLFPKFMLTGSLMGSASDFSGLSLGANRIWSIGPAIRWPVFDAGRIRANIDIQNARQEQALLSYEKTVIQSFAEVENALVLYAQEQNRFEELGKSVEAGEKALAIANDLYAQGLVSYLEVLDAERTLFTARDQRLQSQVSVLTSLVSLYKALGGGWEESTV
ncbi:MAG TPA: efflux transporter outer membrane subunit [Candidatus Hydrogenedentes bacterium]|jgi:NodT family efflux transporter outer membrane factor (OMF) lipoprotein|nr:efflux transporter outer membrane subunit [Candidatus Hydrogenedentota bacterium]HOD96553.1 efflux transporter outer membrane subunit [Candidatus Hydrogenedentota bacterium]HOR51964.1 efflux transporter outer membrane subunit [Candidatus Hydrogenedentota bacterium]HPK26005.1 efflux transporter outer membrane subunit [Candidatus Hydrogenedentota bacterium]HPX87539.1 efflux transporter outer membrane subunit [Candidatus Hydrogenedentota bacterium]